MFAFKTSIFKNTSIGLVVIGMCCSMFLLGTLPAAQADGGGSPGTYEPDPDNQRRPDDHGGPYNEPGSDDQRGGGNDHGGPYNEPGSDGGPY